MIDSSHRSEVTRYEPPRAPPQKIPPASQRQTEIALLLLSNPRASYDEIGQAMRPPISGYTVEFHVRKLARKITLPIDEACTLTPRVRVILWANDQRQRAA